MDNKVKKSISRALNFEPVQVEILISRQHKTVLASVLRNVFILLVFRCSVYHVVFLHSESLFGIINALNYAALFTRTWLI